MSFLGLFFSTLIHFLGGLHFLTENRGQHLYNYVIGKSAPRDYILFFRPYFKDNINKFNVSFICNLNLSSFLGELQTVNT